jgi:hypothetical protein
MALKNKDKLVNSTTEDFLNDFQKEISVANPSEAKAKEEHADDEFVFCVIFSKFFLFFIKNNLTFIGRRRRK